MRDIQKSSGGNYLSNEEAAGVHLIQSCWEGTIPTPEVGERRELRLDRCAIAMSRRCGEVYTIVVSGLREPRRGRRTDRPLSSWAGTAVAVRGPVRR